MEEKSPRFQIFTKHFRLVADDETGLPSVPPGIEADRELYARIVNWEGEGLPASPTEGPADGTRTKHEV